MAQKNEASSLTHDELGVYDCDLDTTDTGTLGRLRLDIQESGAAPVWHEYMVLPANTYDSLVSGSDYLQTDAHQVEGSDATDQIGDAVADEVFEGSLTMRHILRIVLSALAGKSNGGGTGTINFRNNADSGNRITATVDANGNRTAISVSGS